MKKERFDITGMTCSACSSRVDKAVSTLDGVQEVSVNLLKNSMSVSFDPSVTDEKAIVAAVENAGYGVHVHNDRQTSPKTANDTANTEKQALVWRLWISLLFTIPLFYISMGHMVGLPLPGFLSSNRNPFAFAFTQFLLTLPVLAANSTFFARGFKNLFSFAPNMDSLIAIGSGAAFISGIVDIYRMGHAMSIGDMVSAHHTAMNLYFESAAMILTLITLGRYFEVCAKGKTSEAISRLLALAPQSATVIRNGVESRIPVEEVVVGDTLSVKAGESVPVDGVIIEGYGYLDESTLTGESVSAEKQTGDHVFGATINRSGHFFMRVDHVGDDTALAHIIRLVDEATSSKAPIARLADKVSGIFVPTVIAIAGVACGIWILLGYGIAFALSIAISVLVISCPCALGLATPTAIMVGTGKGAENGILFKSAEAIENTQAIDTVVFDKTGTLTEGKPAVTDIIVISASNETKLLSTAASLEKRSGHPLGNAIIEEAARSKIALSNVSGFIQTPGQGIGGTIEGENCAIGNHRLLEAHLIVTDIETNRIAKTLANEGKTVLYVTCEDILLGIIAIADRIRPTSHKAVTALQMMGLAVIMLTGDNTKTAVAIGRQTGITHVLADVLPQDKEKEIRRLGEDSKKAAMVGDGINDAPALARAHVGMAIGAGTDIAIESADVILMKNDPADVVTAIRLSKAVMKTIRQNLFWAFIYNIIGIPVAAGVLHSFNGITLNPMIAAAAMSLSSISVVLNALRLRFFKAHPIVANISTKTGISTNTPSIQTIERKTTMKKTIHIEGMNCTHCSSTVERVLKAVPGVSGVTVNLAGKCATLEAGANVTNDALTAAVTNAGFKVNEIR